MLSDEDARRRLDAFVAEHGPFRAHNMRLSPNVHTIGAENKSWERHGRFVHLASALYGPDLSGLRVLDLACNEGLTAISFAERGAETVGIEARDFHLTKARFVAETLGLKNVAFHCDDVRNVAKDLRYGRFDIVVCSGILYHLEAESAFGLVRDIAAITDRLAIIDTAIALQQRQSIVHAGETYWGRTQIEHAPGDDDGTRLSRSWASLDNATSFAFTRASLITLMSRCGLSAVSELLMPFKYPFGAPRVTLYGFRAPEEASAPERAGAVEAPAAASFPEEPFDPKSATGRRHAPNALDLRTLRKAGPTDG